ncbi:MAG TPA: SDR family oxidoreductase [Candidatus Baltobacteraceae bacterium]|nr:SDR family oxidoreductase [Candidatus Baltobacteraceae bacterium]
MRLHDKVAIVTGGDTGIGKAIAARMAREGASVVIDYHGDAEPATALVEEIENFGGRAYAVAADISKADEVDELVKAAVVHFGQLDVLVNNAGVEEKHPFLEMPLEVWKKVIAIDLTGPWLCSQRAAQQMVHQRAGGRIINISSVHEDITMPTNAPYCAAKGGLRMLMRTIAVELAPHGITVNNVCPGAVDTPMDARLERSPKQYEALLDEIPLHRMGKPEEVASMCVYLASEEASYVTGASFIIDGGMTKQSGSL